MYGVNGTAAAGTSIDGLRESTTGNSVAVSTVLDTETPIHDREETIRADGTEYTVSRTIEPIYRVAFRQVRRSTTAPSISAGSASVATQWNSSAISSGSRPVAPFIRSVETCPGSTIATV